MAYASTEELLQFLQEEETIELSYQGGDVDSLIARSPQLEAGLQSASDEIDSIIGGRFAVPVFTQIGGVPVAPRYLSYACKVICRKQMDLYSSREKVREDYNDVIRRLEAIAASKSALIGADGQPIPDRPVDANITISMSLDCI